ncbi:hypothetical protein HAX54_022635 [Datura stramonium]|uniref:Uncharacterized protein n=1 Tax=Datura stramonium TaxID=4076 RepID=A0ABS8UUM5_DATST|nr:hypothetical protein [Datura stramonium]
MTWMVWGSVGANEGLIGGVNGGCYGGSGLFSGWAGSSEKRVKVAGINGGNCEEGEREVRCERRLGEKENEMRFRVLGFLEY